ncbi:hypothetical protein [Flaviaesturariibacter terrae]
MAKLFHFTGVPSGQAAFLLTQKGFVFGTNSSSGKPEKERDATDPELETL